jgi:DNA-binding NtrC family response regulator
MRNRNILIADEDRLTSWGIERLISPRHALVTTVTSGSEALAEIGRTQYDSIFLDLDLPDVHALKMLRELKQLSPRTHVIAMARHLDPEIKQEALDSGAVHFIGKPFDIPEISKIINSILSPIAD